MKQMEWALFRKRRIVWCDEFRFGMVTKQETAWSLPKENISINEQQ